MRNKKQKGKKKRRKGKFRARQATLGNADDKQEQKQEQVVIPEGDESENGVPDR